MEIRTYNSPNGERKELYCTKAEYEMLKGLLESAGVNLCVSACNLDGYARTCYVLNPSRDVVNLWGDDAQKKLQIEFFERNKNF